MSYATPATCVRVRHKGTKRRGCATSSAGQLVATTMRLQTMPDATPRGSSSAPSALSGHECQLSPRPVRHAISYGGPLDQGPYAGIDLAEAWRGLMLRNRSVGAWRNLWWWLVQELTEPQSLAAVADALAAELPEDWVVADLTTKLPPGVAGNDLLPVEEELRAEHPSPHPLTELRMLAAGAPATRRAKRPGPHGPRRR